MDRAAKQRRVKRAIAASAGLIVVWFWAAWALFPAPDIGADAGARLGFALKCDLAVVACLVVAVGLIARHRFFHNRIDGGWDETDRLLEIYRYNLANTTEQVLIAVPVHLAFAVTAPAGLMGMVPAAATLFCLARAAFLAGYLSGRPTNRGVGFASTFFPSVLMLLAAAWFALAG
ncbi:MAG TPA: MAPEG family protein [Thermohalobaculum sp.]|nr:MAPEG family protein [Thermohalobaculum sp.]